MNISAKFQLYPSLNDFLQKFNLRLPWKPIKLRGLDKNDMFGRGLLKEHFCKTFVKISAWHSNKWQFSFFPLCQWQPSYHSNQVSHLKPKVTTRQLSGYHNIKSIYVETMFFFKVNGGMAIILNSYGRERYAVVRYGTKTAYDDLKIRWLWVGGPRVLIQSR